jgi:raffinose/stachyose/melibiose transport system permease protein
MKAKQLWIIVFLTPTVLVTVVLFLVPTLLLVATSFFDYDSMAALRNIGSFVGLENYKDFILDPRAESAFPNTLIWLVLQTTVHVALALLVAIVLRRLTKLRGFVRTVYAIPNMITLPALALAIKMLMHPRLGVVNRLVELVTGQPYAHNWFGSVDTAFFAVTLTIVPWAGIAAILLMTDIASIPDELYESAEVDGATDFQKDRFITIPMVRNMLGTVTILGVTSMLNDFGMIMVTTWGGPGYKTFNLPYLVYRMIWSDRRYGVANSGGTIILIVGMLLVYVVMKVYKLGKIRPDE